MVSSSSSPASTSSPSASSRSRPRSRSPRFNLPRSETEPWYRVITLDLLFLILANSVFHPYVSFIFYLCIAALHKHREPIAHYTLWYTAFLVAVEVAAWANQRVTYGRHRKVAWESEVVVITGGASGLGRAMAEMLLRKGVSVAVLDTKGPDEQAKETMERWDLVWEVVDVSDARKVERAVEKVIKEVCFSRSFRFPFSLLIQSPP